VSAIREDFQGPRVQGKGRAFYRKRSRKNTGLGKDGKKKVLNKKGGSERPIRLFGG
jgi:hypothetical protein